MFKTALDNYCVFNTILDAKHMTIAKIYTAKLIWENYKTMKKAEQQGRRKSVFKPMVIIVFFLLTFFISQNRFFFNVPKESFKHKRYVKITKGEEFGVQCFTFVAKYILSSACLNCRSAPV